MPIQAPQWTEFLSCPICCHEFDGEQRGPISLGCGHTVCRGCLAKLQRNQCPYDQTVMRLELDQLPVNGALLSLVNHSDGSNGSGSQKKDGIDNHSLSEHPPPAVPPNHAIHYFTAIKSIKELALLLKPYAGSGFNGSSTSILSRPMQRKLVTLINCQLVEEEGRARAVRAARSLGERTVTELILHHQNHHQLSANLWAAVRSRGCQFLGPAMQEEVLKLVLLALEDGSALSRKVLVMFVVQRLEPHFPQASKTSIGHVVQLLYRASCFKVSKREGDSSLMQLKEEFRTYEALRREHDAQIVQIATEAGLRIAPDQWSSLLYGDTAHKSHMQSIIDKLQTPQSFGQSVQELVIALQRTGDPGQLSSLRHPLELLAGLDPSPDSDVPGWESCSLAMEAVKTVVKGLVQFIQHHGNRKITEAHHPHNAKYKTNMCRDLTQRGGCPRGNDCTFAHSEDEMDKYRSRSRKHKNMASPLPSAAFSTPPTKVMQQSPHQSKNDNQPHTQHLQTPKNSPYSISPRPPTEPKKIPNAHTRSQPPIPHQIHQPPPTPTSRPLSPTPLHPQPLTPNPILTLPTHSIHHPEMVRPILKNGERAGVLPLIGKHMVVEEMIQSGMAPPTINQYEAPKYIHIPPHSASLSVMPGTPNGNVIRSALAPPPPHTPIFAPPIHDYAYGTFHPPGTIFAQAGPAPPGSVPAALHPATAGGPPPSPYSPQHPPPMMPEMYSPGAQTLLMNQGQVYNIISPAREFAPPPQVVVQTTIAETRQTNMIDKSVVSSWLDSTDSQMPNERFTFTNSPSMQATIVSDSPPCSVDALACKSMSELKERKEELLNQLENIVGKEAVDEVASQIENGDLQPETSSTSPDFSSTYSIWTSGANFSSWSEKSPEKNWDPTRGYRTYHSKQEKDDDFIPFDPPVVSRFGPISRMTKPFVQTTRPIQVSACNTTDPVTTPTAHRPVPAISPMLPQVVYQHPGFTAFVSYPPPLDYMNTIGHGIIDPPQVHMSILDPSGSRPSDPIMERQPECQEELQRQQFIAVKEGLDQFCFNQKFEEMRLKEELSRVMQGIQKKREIEEMKQDQNPQDEDMTDFEKTWKFDFDEGEKDE